jgi:hypothetical protein
MSLAPLMTLRVPSAHLNVKFENRWSFKRVVSNFSTSRAATHSLGSRTGDSGHG